MKNRFYKAIIILGFLQVYALQAQALQVVPAAPLPEGEQAVRIVMDPDSVIGRTSELNAKIILRSAELKLMKLENKIGKEGGFIRDILDDNERITKESYLRSIKVVAEGEGGKLPQVAPEVLAPPVILAQQVEETPVLLDDIRLLSIKGVGKKLSAKIIINGAVRVVKRGSKIGSTQFMSITSRGIWVKYTGEKIKKFIDFSN